jgi:hypothetical protein
MGENRLLDLRSKPPRSRLPPSHADARPRAGAAKKSAKKATKKATKKVAAVKKPAAKKAATKRKAPARR